MRSIKNLYKIKEKYGLKRAYYRLSNSFFFCSNSSSEIIPRSSSSLYFFTCSKESFSPSAFFFFPFPVMPLGAGSFVVFAVFFVPVAADADICTLSLLKRESGIVGGRVGDKRRVPSVHLRQIAIVLSLDIIIAIAVGHNGHLLGIDGIGGIQLSAVVARHLQMVAAAVHNEQRRG